MFIALLVSKIFMKKEFECTQWFWEFNFWSYTEVRKISGLTLVVKIIHCKFTIKFTNIFDTVIEHYPIKIGSICWVFSMSLCKSFKEGYRNKKFFSFSMQEDIPITPCTRRIPKSLPPRKQMKDLLKHPEKNHLKQRYI